MPTTRQALQEATKVFNTPNYSGILYTSTPLETPFLTLIGGVGGSRAKLTENFEFPTCSLYELDPAVQPAISEDTSMTAPQVTTVLRTQNTNVTQIHHETIEVTYSKQANQGRLSGINTAGAENTAGDELNFQIARKMEKIARDIEYSFINGVFEKATSSSTANKTRGIISAAGTVVTASNNAELTYDIISQTMQEAWNNGALFKDFYFFVNGAQKRKLTKIFQGLNGFSLPATRNEGGLNITSFETDFGVVKIVLDKFVPNDTVVGADISVIAPVEQNTPNKGNFFLEDLSKTGASDKKQIFGMIGLDHGPGYMHLVIKGLATT